MAYEHCTVEKDGHVLTITINRPDRMNALHPPANAELAQAFDDFAADPDLWVAILTGAGDRAFSAGNDLRYQAEGNAVTVPPSGFAGITSRYDLDKPVIAINTATYWHALRANGLMDRVEGCGRLLEEF